MQQITAHELKHRLQQDEPMPLLLDVREPNEFAFCRIEGSVNKPMNQIFEDFSGLDPRKETVVICHHGMRSAQVVNFLISHGFEKVTNLQGGVAAWASDVDKAMPRY